MKNQIMRYRTPTIGICFLIHKVDAINKNMKSAFIGGILLLALVHISLAQQSAEGAPSEWEKIGEVSVSLRNQTGSITVNGADRFVAIKLRVIDVSMEIDKLLVFYENGALQEIDATSAPADDG